MSSLQKTLFKELIQANEQKASKEKTILKQKIDLN